LLISHSAGSQETFFNKAVKAVSDNRGIGDQKVKGRLDTDWGGFQAKLAANAIHKGHSSTHFY